MQKCPKCQSDMPDEQKVCVKCGAYLPSSGIFYQDTKPRFEFKPTRNMYIAAGAVFLVIIIFIVYSATRPVEPETVAREWFQLLVDKKPSRAESMITENMQSYLQVRMKDCRSLSDEFSDQMGMYNGTFDVKKMQGVPIHKEDAVVIDVNMTFDSGVRRVRLFLVPDGRSWKIDQMQ